MSAAKFRGLPAQIAVSCGLPDPEPLLVEDLLAAGWIFDSLSVVLFLSSGELLAASGGRAIRLALRGASAAQRARYGIVGVFFFFSGPEERGGTPDASSGFCLFLAHNSRKRCPAKNGGRKPPASLFSLQMLKKMKVGATRMAGKRFSQQILSRNL